MCTGLRFTDDKGNLYFGRNLDVGQDYGEGVIIHYHISSWMILKPLKQ